MQTNPFFELHAGLPQQGPGSDATTARAFKEVAPQLPPRPRVLDMGCGTGRQTLELARLAPHATIEAVDSLLMFLAELERRALGAGVGDRVTTRAASMIDPRFRESPADLIWSEGAIYNVGLQPGLEAWREFLQPGGQIALTHLSWLTNSPPEEPLAFWRTAYPEMRTLDDNLARMRELGFEVTAHFTIPASDWDAYYEPQSARHQLLSDKYAGDANALAALGDQRAEMELYRNYSDAYGYVFYVLR